VAIGRGDDRGTLELLGIRRCAVVAAVTSDDLVNVAVGLAASDLGLLPPPRRHGRPDPVGPNLGRGRSRPSGTDRTWSIQPQIPSASRRRRSHRPSPPALSRRSEAPAPRRSATRSRPAARPAGGRHQSTRRDNAESRASRRYSRSMCAGGSRCTRSAGLTASTLSSTAELRQTPSVPSALLTVFAASWPAAAPSASSATKSRSRRPTARRAAFRRKRAGAAFAPRSRSPTKYRARGTDAGDRATAPSSR